MFLEVLMALSVGMVFTTAVGLFVPEKQTRKQMKPVATDMQTQTEHPEQDNVFSPQALLTDYSSPIQSSVQEFADSPIAPIFQFFEAVQKGDYTKRSEVRFSVFGHEAIQAEIWAFDRSNDKKYIIIDLGGLSVIDFTWYGNGEIDGMNNPHGLLTDENFDAFNHEVRKTLESLRFFREDEAPQLSLAIESLNRSVDAINTKVNPAFPVSHTPATLAAGNSDIRESFQAINETYHQIIPFLSDLQLEDQHNIERIVEDTYPKLVRAYCQLDNAQQMQQLSAFLTGLQNIQDELQHRLDRLNQMKGHEFEKRLQMTQFHS